jgi:hypothetical protein
MPQPLNFSLVNTGDPAQATLHRASVRAQCILAALAGAAAATTGSGAALYTADQAATYALACADAVVAALVAEG